MESEEPEVSLSNALRRLIQKRFSERVMNPDRQAEKSLNNLGKRIRSLELKEKESSLKVRPESDTEERPDLSEPDIEPEQNASEGEQVLQMGKSRDILMGSIVDIFIENTSSL